MASNYSFIRSDSLSYSSNSSPQLYGNKSGRNMGVIVTGPWPMSQPIPEQPFSAKLSRDIKDCKSCKLSPHSRQGSVRHSQNIRPVSMPPSFTMVTRSQDSCYSESSIELMPLNPHAAVPCRGSVSIELNPTPSPTCVPWLKKMTVLKKIQRKIGIGSRGGGMSPNNMPPLLFHNVHGENVTISQNGSVAKRTNSFCKAIAFSDRPVKVAEKVCLKFVEVSVNWSGVLRLGFTSQDPSTLRSGLPRYACPDLTSRPGFWAKAFSDFYVKKDSVLFYYANSAGDVHFGINGEEKGVFFSGVDTRGPLWAMLDIYGNTTCVEFVDPRAHLNNSRRSINESSNSSREEIESNLSEILPSFNSLKLNGMVEPTVPDIQHYLDAEMQDLAFHRVRGKNIMLTADSLPNMAIRRAGEYCSAYVFTAKPISPGETIVIQVLHMDGAYTSSMAFGLTSCNPQSICSEALPEDSHLLLDRPEYWVVKKDVANSPCTRDVLAFSVNHSGEVTMTKNDGSPIVLMHVDNSVPLWAFFDLYGTTDRIRLIGSIKCNMRHSEGSQSRDLPFPSSSSRLPSVQQFSSSNNYSHPSPTINGRAQDYFELSHSPNSIEPSVLASKSRSHLFPVTLTTHEAGPSVRNSHSPPKELSNWSVECVACCERPVDSVFYTCGHMCMCYSCAVEYWKTKEKGCCPICRAAISDVIRTYKS